MQRQAHEPGDWPVWVVFVFLSFIAIGFSGLLLGFSLSTLPWVVAIGLGASGLATAIATLISQRTRRGPPSDSR